MIDKERARASIKEIERAVARAKAEAPTSEECADDEPFDDDAPQMQGLGPMPSDSRSQIITDQIQNLREQIRQARHSADSATDRKFRALAVNLGVSLSRELRQWLVYLDDQDTKKAAKEAAKNAPLPPVLPGDTPPQLQAADPLKRPSPMADDEMALDDVTPFIEPVAPPPAKPAEEPAPATPDAPVEASANRSRQRRRTASHV